MVNFALGVTILQWLYLHDHFSSDKQECISAGDLQSLCFMEPSISTQDRLFSDEATLGDVFPKRIKYSSAVGEHSVLGLG